MLSVLRIHDQPNVAEAHRTAVLLKDDWQQIGRFWLSVAGRMRDGDLLVNGIAVLPDVDHRVLGLLACTRRTSGTGPCDREARVAIVDIVRLPGERRQAHV